MSGSSGLRLGIVSNCWKVQFEEQQSLTDLIEEAVRRQFCAIELRQGFLGEYESHIGDAASSASARRELADLSLRFPVANFNLAVSLPCFNGQLLEDDRRFANALAASRALATRGCPHLRLVDTETRAEQLNEGAIAQSGTLLASLARQVIKANGTLSIEHAYQPWSIFWPTFQFARHELGAESLRLRCCFDPCNLLLTESPASVPAIVESIQSDDVSMIHLKQRAGGSIQPDVAEGDLDWPLLMRILRQRQHVGAWLFEVAPHADIWANLERSVRRLF